MMLTSLFIDYLLISLSISLVIVGLLIFSPVLRKHYSAKWRYWIWMVLAICLLVPFNFPVENSLITIQVQKNITTEHIWPNAAPAKQAEVDIEQVNSEDERVSIPNPSQSPVFVSGQQVDEEIKQIVNQPLDHEFNNVVSQTEVRKLVTT